MTVSKVREIADWLRKQAEERERVHAYDVDANGLIHYVYGFVIDGILYIEGEGTF